MWVTDGVNDKFLKPNEQIPNGFYKGRSYGGEEKRKEISNRISAHTKGRVCWNKGKHIGGENNGRYGSRMMFNIKTQTKCLVSKDEIQKYLNNGYVFMKDLKIFNNGYKDILSDKCPDGFIEGSFKCKVYWWNNGIIEKMCKNQPGKDFKMGRLKKVKIKAS